MWTNRNACSGVITVNAPTRPAAEIARLGREIYEREIRKQVEAAHHGEVVAIDVDTGTWAVGDNVIAATGRLQEKRPEAVNVLSERVGLSCAAALRWTAPAESRVIQGVVNAAYEPVITLALQGPSGQSRDIEAVVDTGFNGFSHLAGRIGVRTGTALHQHRQGDSRRRQRDSL